MEKPCTCSFPVHSNNSSAMYIGGIHPPAPVFDGKHSWSDSCRYVSKEWKSGNCCCKTLVRMQMIKGRAKRANITFLLFFSSSLSDVYALKYKYVWVYSIVLPFLIHANFFTIGGAWKKWKWGKQKQSSFCFVPWTLIWQFRKMSVSTLFLFGSTRIIFFSCAWQRLCSYSTGCIDRLVHCVCFKELFIMGTIECFSFVLSKYKKYGLRETTCVHT